MLMTCSKFTSHAHHPPLSSVTATCSSGSPPNASNMVLHGVIIPTGTFQSQRGCALWLDAAEDSTIQRFLSWGIGPFSRLGLWCWIFLVSALGTPNTTPSLWGRNTQDQGKESIMVSLFLQAGIWKYFCSNRNWHVGHETEAGTLCDFGAQQCQ